MRGKKAKALRAMVGYDPTQRLESAGSVPRGTVLRVPREHPRKAYQFVKERYGLLPLAQALPRLKKGM